MIKNVTQPREKERYVPECLKDRYEPCSYDKRRNLREANNLTQQPALNMSSSKGNLNDSREQLLSTDRKTKVEMYDPSMI